MTIAPTDPRVRAALDLLAELVAKRVIEKLTENQKCEAPHPGRDMRRDAKSKEQQLWPDRVPGGERPSSG